MRASYFAGAYWGCRPESAEECALRAETFFRLLAECHPSYARWYEKNNSVKKSLELQFEPTRETFVRFFGMKKYRLWENQDGDFTCSAWTGHVKQEQGGMLSLHCGGDAEAFPNSLLLYFPVEDLGHERMLTSRVINGVMRAMAVAWDPDWALITTDELRDELSRHDEADTFVGWMTYITRRWGEIPPLPEPVRVEPVGTQGSLIILTPERLTISNPAHVALGHQVQRTLEEHGVLRRLLEPRTPT